MKKAVKLKFGNNSAPLTQEQLNIICEFLSRVLAQLFFHADIICYQVHTHKK